MVHFLMGLLVMMSTFLTETSGWVPNPEASAPDNWYLDEPDYKEDVVTEGRCSFVYRFTEGALDPQGPADTVPAHVLLETVYGLNDINGVRREWLARCQEVHTEMADTWPDREDTLELTIENTYDGELASSWSLHYLDFLASTSANYGSQYLILSKETGLPVTLGDLVEPAQLEAFVTRVETYVLGPGGVGLSVSDSGLVESWSGLAPMPSGFLADMSVGYGVDGLMVFGWLPVTLGNFPVAVTVPWGELQDFNFVL